MAIANRAAVRMATAPVAAAGERIGGKSALPIAGAAIRRAIWSNFFIVHRF